MVDTYDLSDATADSLALTREAMRQRTGIRVLPTIIATRGVLGYWTEHLAYVLQDDTVHAPMPYGKAQTFADELAGELIDAGDPEL